MAGRKTRIFGEHEAAALFPLMEGPDLDDLVADIAEHGLREPITVIDGEVLDGRNRLRACEKLGIEPRTVAWDGNGSPQAFVVSMNLHRRHLNDSQRALIAAKLATAKRGYNRYRRVDVDKSTSTQKEAAAMLNVSRDSVINAKKVLRDGTADEIAAVEAGRARVTTLAKHIRTGRPATERKKRRAEPLAQVGRNPERIEKQRMNAEIWRQVRDALTHLTSLPRPADAAAIARKHDKTGLIDSRLGRSIQWLKEFEDEWSNSDQVEQPAAE